MSRARRWSQYPVAALAAIGAVVASGACRAPQVPAPKRHVVEITGMAFHPDSLEVRQGDTIVWINRDIVSHTATASRKAAWTTGTLAQDQSGLYVARDKGEDPYFCELHPVMLGRLTVR